MGRLRRRGGTNEDLDESVGLAGWLYTDLLLGLVVVFLGGVAYFVAVESSDANGVAGTVATSTTTTSTIPASTTTTTTTTTTVPQCRTLYAPSDIPTDGVYISVPASNNIEQLSQAFVESIQQELQLESLKVGAPEFRFEDLAVGMAIFSGGVGSQGDISAGARVASRVSALLREGFPEQFRNAVFRGGGSRDLSPNIVGIEILPYVNRDC